MAIKVTTTTTYTCDCCGREGSDKDFTDRSRCGSSTIKIKGGSGAAAYNGDWGGLNHDIDKFVCYECADEVIQFMYELRHK